MRLLSLKITHAVSCAGILDGLDVTFQRDPIEENQALSPLCLIGPNGSGKSQLLQLMAEIFQGAWHTQAPDEERRTANSDVLFELYYQIHLTNRTVANVCLSRTEKTKPKGHVDMRELKDGEWVSIEPGTPQYRDRLPPVVIGYSSGDNETLSLPFFVSRAGYAKDVRESALKRGAPANFVPENRLLYIDYATHLEVLIANLLLGGPRTDKALLEHAGLESLASCRCIVQLNPSSGPNKGIVITDELQGVIADLRRAATCWNHEPKHDTHVFDFFVDGACREAFKHFFKTAERLYRSFHKLAMLNDLSISRTARRRFERDIKRRRFAAKLPEPQDEDKVFRFEHVKLRKQSDDPILKEVDYVSLSDGEHQQSQIFGLFAMINDLNALFILDEPESHFNPQWRVEFVKRLLSLPGDRRPQEVILTSHAPFVASDVSRENVLIFAKVDGEVRVSKPDIETYGAPFDRILEHCFAVRPPISAMARDDIEHLRTEGTIEELQQAMSKLGSSVQKAMLADRLRQLEAKKKSE